MRVVVTVRPPSGELLALGHGALIGRLWSADLQLNDPRVSEAHAMISLRGRDVRLLALRGRFAVNGKTCADVVLEPGMFIALASDLEIEIVDVRVPSAVLALEGDGVARQVLVGVTSLFGGSRPRLVNGWDSGADDVVYPTGSLWMRGLRAPQPLQAGENWRVAGVEFRAVEERVAGTDATQREVGYSRPLQITARFDTVHIARRDEAVVVITGYMARVLSELVAVDAPLSWEDLARQLWGDSDRDLLRRRWDMLLLRFRQKLRDHDLRTDLIQADGTGLVELVLSPEDHVVDAT